MMSSHASAKHCQTYLKWSNCLFGKTVIMNCSVYDSNFTMITDILKVWTDYDKSWCDLWILSLKGRHNKGYGSKFSCWFRSTLLLDSGNTGTFEHIVNKIGLQKTTFFFNLSINFGYFSISHYYNVECQMPNHCGGSQGVSCGTPLDWISGAQQSH